VLQNRIVRGLKGTQSWPVLVCVLCSACSSQNRSSNVAGRLGCFFVPFLDGCSGLPFAESDPFANSDRVTPLGQEHRA
jgi:hypothetical protein